MASARTLVDIDGRQLSLSNLDKVMYPQTGTTKAAVIDYYTRIAPVLLPHIKGRPLTMIRFPDGVDGNSFFEKRCPEHRPDWLGTVELGRVGRDKVVDHCDVRDVPGLVWTANMAALELHVPMSAAPDTYEPRAVVFDLDPGPPADVQTCAEVALLLKGLFDRMGLVACPKTSGSKGLQVYVPGNIAGLDYERTRGFALGLGQLLERVHGDLVLTQMAKSKRDGKVFVDWSQNHHIKTTVAVYSLRAKDTPTVSTPLTWDEVSDGADGKVALSFTMDEVLARVADHGDLFRPVLDIQQEIPALG